MMERTQFMGHDFSYWTELQKRVDDIPNAERLLSEIAVLRAKVSFYESRICEMREFMDSLRKGGV
jgi:hypothetical protein